MNSDEKFIALSRERDLKAFAIVGTARCVAEGLLKPEKLKQKIAEYDAAHQALEDYQNSDEYKNFWERVFEPPQRKTEVA